MNPIDGIINLDKPAGVTSAKALYRVRGITGQRKSGHAGTLDPMATGVLILCLGKATKLVEKIMQLPKVYRATARLDVTSESFDADRETTPVDVTSIPSEEDVRAALAALTGEINQTPPAISALKVGGVPSYRHASEGTDIPLAPRKVMVYWMHVHSFTWPELDFEVCCGRGTYIRALARDLGTALRTGGCLTALRRTQVGPFTADEGWTPDRLEARDSNASGLVSLERARAVVDDPNALQPPEPPAAVGTA